MPDSSYASLLVHLVIAIDRLIKGQKIKLSQDKILKLKKYNEYSIASLIAEKLSHKYNIKIPEAEVANITVHLISSNLRLEYLLNENIKDREKVLVETVREMIESAKDYINIDSINYKKLENGNSSIYTRNHYANIGVINVDPRHLKEGEEKILFERLKDMDGTLLNDEQLISEQNAKKLLQCIRKGISNEICKTALEISKKV